MGRLAALRQQHRDAVGRCNALRERVDCLRAQRAEQESFTARQAYLDAELLAIRQVGEANEEASQIMLEILNLEAAQAGIPT